MAQNRPPVLTQEQQRALMVGAPERHAAFAKRCQEDPQIRALVRGQPIPPKDQTDA